jgi:hypothetical protein
MLNRTTPARPVPWTALCAVDAAVSAVTLVAFGLFGGLMLLVAREAQGSSNTNYPAR